MESGGDWTTIKPEQLVRLVRGDQIVQGTRHIITFHNYWPDGNYRLGVTLYGIRPTDSSYDDFFMQDDGWEVSSIEKDI